MTTLAFALPCALHPRTSIAPPRLSISHPRTPARARVRSISLLDYGVPRVCMLSGAPPRGTFPPGNGGGRSDDDYSSSSDGPDNFRAAALAIVSALLARYAHVLTTRPFATKSATTGVLMMLSDWLAQTLTRPALELERLARYLFYGLCVAGPMTHYWFAVLERAVSAKGAVAVLQKVVLDQCVAAPVFLAIFVLYMHVAEGGKMTGASASLREQHKNALCASIRVWPLVNLFNFSVVPAPHRVAFVAAFNVVWVAYLSVSTAKPAGDGPIVADIRPS